MKPIHLCVAACAVLTVQPALAQEASDTRGSAPGAHALMVRDGKIVHVRKGQKAARPPAAETVTTQVGQAGSARPGEHVVAVRNGRIVYIPKRTLATP